MTTVAQSAAPTLDPAHRVPIADLSPSSSESPSHILATVALVWPYSSSTGILALLLADPDIRRRKSKGQVKVVFRDGCAREVAQTKVGIGDVVRLALAGCQWKDTGDFVSTPGKKIDWDLEFRTRVALEILRDDQETSSVDYTSNEHGAPATEGNVALCNNIEGTHALANGAEPLPSTIQVPQFSPSKATRASLGGSFIDAFLDPLNDQHEEDEDGNILGRGRKRTKFARHSGAWSLVDSDANLEPAAEPEPEPALQNGEAEQDQSVQSAQIDLTSNHSDHDGDKEKEEVPAEHVPDAAMPQTPPALVPAPDEDGDPEHSSPPSSTASTELDSVAAPIVMGPPQTPLRVARLQPIHDLGTDDASTSSDAVTTPRLHPLPSPGLPLVSPLIRASGVELGYFPQSGEIVSQLDASGKSLHEETVDDIEDEESDSSESSDSEASLAIVDEASAQPKQAALSLESEVVEDLSFPRMDESLEPIELAAQAIQEPAEADDQGERPSEMDLSAPEATIADELSHPENGLSATITAVETTEVVEIEDDDLYGAPQEESKGDSFLPASLSLEQQRSPLDVLEEFLQMSPVAVTAPSSIFEFPVASATEAPQMQPTVPDVGHLESQQEETVVAAVESPSTGAYPQPEFRETKIQHVSSASSSRRSSYHSQAPSLDGHIDENSSFGDDQSRVPEVVRSSTEPESQTEDTTDAIDHVGSEEALPEGAVRGAAEAVRDASVFVEELERPVIDTSLSEEADIVADQEALPVGSASPDGLLVAPLDGTAAQVLLPTPDQTQEPQRPPSLDEEINKDPVKESSETQLPSPRHTQLEELEDIEADEGGTVHDAPREGTDAQVTETAAPPTELTESTTMTPRRTSERLSARKSTMARNFSSPYFSPRKSAQALPSSPVQEENTHPADFEPSNIPSSPVREHSNSLKTPSVNDADEFDDDDLEGTEPLLPRQPGITTSLSYYPHLASLQDHFGQAIDIIAVCTDPSSNVERSRTGPKDYHTTLLLADLSLDTEERPVVVSQVFRPVKNALPTTRRGDVVLLRNFKVQTTRRKPMLLSTDTSSWAVFQTSESGPPDVTVSGPPVEYGPAEADYVNLNVRWWDEQGGSRFPSRSGTMEESSAGPGTQVLNRIRGALRSTHKTTPSNRRKENMTDNMGSESNMEEVFEADDHTESSPLMDKTNRRRESTISTAPSDGGKGFTPRRSARHMKSPSVVHELRDGTKYVDDDRRRSGSVIHELRDGVSYVDE